MKRRLLVIGICLLLGGVVNVSVAWGCALLAPASARSVSARAFRPFFHRSYLTPRIVKSTLASRTSLSATVWGPG